MTIRRMVALLLLCGLAPSAWAAFESMPGTSVDLTELTSEMKQVVPALEGCAQELDRVVCRRLDGEFLPAEFAALQQVVTAHDPDSLDPQSVSGIG